MAICTTRTPCAIAFGDDMYTPGEVEGFEQSLTALSLRGIDTEELSADAALILRFILYRSEEAGTDRLSKKLMRELPWNQRRILTEIIPLFCPTHSGKSVQLTLERFNTPGKMNNAAKLEDMRALLHAKLMRRKADEADEAAQAAQAAVKTSNTKTDASKAKTKAKKARAKANKIHATARADAE
jgi:hypothetical protein